MQLLTFPLLVSESGSVIVNVVQSYVNYKFMYNTTGTDQQLIQTVPSNVSSSLDNLGNQFLIQDLTRDWFMYIKSSSDSSKPRIGLLENGNEGTIRYYFRNTNV